MPDLRSDVRVTPPAGHRPMWSAGICLAALAALWLGAAPPARAATITINFETTPSLPTQPSTFAAAGAAQTITVAGIGTLTGGAVLGNPTFLPAFTANGSLPNTYGTFSGAAGGYANLQLNFFSQIAVTNVAGRLFNGLSDDETYTVRAFSGANQVAQQVLSLTDNLDPVGSTALFSLSSSAITRISFASASPSFFNYFTDNLVVTFTVPEPSSVMLMGIGIGVLGLGTGVWRRRGEPA